jgi:GGDEF domain-containing protein
LRPTRSAEDGGAHQRRLGAPPSPRGSAPPTRGGALLLVDVDRFSEVNARHGHPAADAVLAGVAATLPELWAMRLPSAGSAATSSSRWFRAPTGRRPCARPDQVCLAVRRMTVAVRSPAGRRTVGGVTVSVGVAVHPATAPDVGLLLWAADAALYAAKRDGGDSAQAVDPRHHL